VRDPIEIVILKSGNGLIGNPYAVGADLLIVAHHHHLFGDVEQKKALDAQLTGLIDNNQIIAPGCRVDHLGHKITWHDPHRDGVAALIHVLPRCSTQPLNSSRAAFTLTHRLYGFSPASECSGYLGRKSDSVEEMGPRPQRCRFGKQFSDCLVGIVPALPNLLPVGDIRAFSQPVVGNRPTPSTFPITEPVIPCFITDTARYSTDKSTNRWPECRLYALTKLLVASGLFDLSNLLVGLAIGCDFSLFDGLDQRRDDGMRVVEVSCGPEIAQTRCDLFGR
jgi:hypothetical protein